MFFAKTTLVIVLLALTIHDGEGSKLQHKKQKHERSQNRLLGPIASSVVKVVGTVSSELLCLLNNLLGPNVCLSSLITVIRIIVDKVLAHLVCLLNDLLAKVDCILEDILCSLGKIIVGGKDLLKCCTADIGILFTFKFTLYQVYTNCVSGVLTDLLPDLLVIVNKLLNFLLPKCTCLKTDLDDLLCALIAWLEKLNCQVKECLECGVEPVLKKVTFIATSLVKCLL